MMKRYYKILALMLAILLNIGFVCDAYGQSDDEVERTIEYFNGIRNRVKVNSLTQRNELKNAALIHSKYMYYNDSFSSIEESEKLYYRGRYPTNRAIYYDYDEPYVYELLGKNASTYKAVLNNYIYNPYSRTVLFDPVYDHIGMASFQGYYTFLFGGEKRSSNREVVYPYNNQHSVPASWSNTYNINPYLQAGVMSGSYGIPVTYTYYSDTLKVKSFDIREAKIVNEKTQENVPIIKRTPQNDKYLKNTLVLLPTEAYKPNSNYKVELEFTVYFTNGQSHPFSFKGEFSTAGTSYNPYKNEILVTRAKCTEEIIKSLGFMLQNPLSIEFHDVDIESPSAKYIYTAYKKGIVNGYETGLFAPERNITKQEVYTILVKAYESKKNTTIKYNNYLNVNDYDEISQWCIDGHYIHKAKALEILLTDYGNRVNPDAFLTEKEFDIIIDKLYDTLKQ